MFGPKGQSNNQQWDMILLNHHMDDDSTCIVHVVAQIAALSLSKSMIGRDYRGYGHIPTHPTTLSDAV